MKIFYAFVVLFQYSKEPLLVCYPVFEMGYNLQVYYSLLTHTCSQNLGLEEVGVKMTKNGAIEVMPLVCF